MGELAGLAVVLASVANETSAFFALAFPLTKKTVVNDLRVQRVGSLPGFLFVARAAN
jgi:hypothetical protein